MEDDDDPFASSSMYELAGFVEVVMAGEKTQLFSEATNASSSSQGKLFENAKCRLSGEGTDVHILLETGALLYPLSDSCEQQADDAGALKDGGRRRIAAVAASQGESFHTPIFQGNIHAMVEDAGTESGGKKRRWSRKSRSMRSIVHDLYRLSTQNDVKVVGKITRVLKQCEKIRVVALLDIYLPSSLWSEHNYWKPGKVAASVLSHLSCDWEDRAMKLYEQCRNFERDASEFSNVWQVGCCHVLGCKMHEIFSISENRAKFNLYELFQCLPPIHKAHSPLGTAIHPSDKDPLQRGLYDLNDDILRMIFTKLSAKDLHSLTSTCHHTRRLCRDIIPNLTLKLFPHQRAAVAWMLQREQNALKFIDPVIKELQTKDGFLLYLNLVTGELTPDSPIEVMDFRGGLFCDEPGLGKTITALALILKTQGSFCQPPPGLQVTWFDNYFKEKLGYYELIESRTTSGRRSRASHKADDLIISSVEDLLYADNQLPEDSLGVSPCRCIDSPPHEKNAVLLSGDSLNLLANSAYDESFTVNTNLSGTKRKLFDPTGNYERELGHHDFFEMKNESRKKSPSYVSRSEEQDLLHAGIITENGTYVELSKSHIVKDLWLQCDACRKWRKWPGGQIAPDENIAWFCSMNKDPAYNSCSFPEEEWDKNERVFELPGFRKSGSACGGKSNVRFFLQVLKEHAHCLDYHTTGVLNWLANLSEDQLTKIAVEGIALPQSLRCSPHIDRICEAFGFVQHLHKTKAPRWFYPENLYNLVFDSKALKTALTHPVGRSTRVYLSNATLIVAPSNLVHHWRNQIRKHTKPGQLSVYVWNENKKAPPPHGLAWDYDIVITTFSRLSTEWSRKEESALMQVHWLRIILDEGHTLGASVCMTNKLQVAISMHSSYRWILTGTPMPNTPSTQLAHLHPMLKFLHENLYGQNSKWWESSVLRPFEAGCEDGRARLLRLLQRTMISSRKSDMQNIPPCIRKVKLLDFTAKHAASYNELVMTVRRNILLADWNDPDHVESLLNPKQYKSRSNTLRNVRLSCCVAGHIKMRDAGRDVKETLDMFVQQGVERYSFEYRVIESSLVYGSNCNRCSEWCRLPIVTSCKHFLCLSCVALDSAKCTSPDCGRAYKMQSPKARPENPNPKWPVPQDVIELQPSYAQEDWHVDWKETSSSKVAYLIKQLKLLQSANVQEPHLNNCAEKVIVYSQFLEHIYVIEEQFTAAGIQHTGLYTPLHSAKKIKSLMTFQNNLDCMVLIMDGSAALGLDLSFVTHVYLMEPIWDRSMEEQVVSRAHRMGATRAIYVETLAMRGTIEEQMLLSLETGTYAHVDEKVSSNPKASQRVTHDPTEGHYLAHLSFVRTQV